MKELSVEDSVCLALGYFDSVHLGHRKLIEAATEYSRSHNCECAVATFINNAYKVFNREEKTVYTYKERCMLLDGICDSVLPMRFDARLKDKPAEEFLDGLFARYKIKAVVCGYDYLFGAGAKGDANLLKSYCAAHGVDCIVLDKFEYDGVRVSTSMVKQLLAEGDIEKANVFLGKPFMLCGKVVPGRGVGRMFDIPTANIKVSIDKLLPRRGVYGATCYVDGNTYSGAVNVGGRPTFGLTKTVVEIMLKDFADNIYDKEVIIYLHKYLRDVQKFDTPALLSKQVREDIAWEEK